MAVDYTVTFSSSLASSMTDGRASISIEGIDLMRSLNAVCETTAGWMDSESSRFWSGARLHLISLLVEFAGVHKR
jgi:hypothetical protein